MLYHWARDQATLDFSTIVFIVWFPVLGTSTWYMYTYDLYTPPTLLRLRCVNNPRTFICHMGLRPLTHPYAARLSGVGLISNIQPSLGVDKMCVSRSLDSFILRRLNVLTLLFAVCISTICCFPTGAPAAACSTLSPSHGAPAQTTSVPYEINMDIFRDPETGNLLYTPNSPYNSKLKSQETSNNLSWTNEVVLE